MPDRTWTLDLPDSEYVSPNKRVHWTVRSERNAVWRKASYALALERHIPPLSRIHVTLEYQPGDNRRRDEDNLVSGVLKPCVDGLVDAGVVPDDTAEYVTRAMPTITPGKGQRRWLLTVTERTADAA